MEYAFDLDGTLAQTKDVITLAYQRAGVTPPEGFFGHPWQEWLSDPMAHMRKNEEYIKLIEQGFVKPTQLVQLFNRTGGIVITGASKIAAHAVLASLNIYPDHVYAELTMRDKVDVLNSRSYVWDEFNHGGIVFEDDLKVATLLTKEAVKWTVCHVLS